ncbi:PREDICTED: sodium- and chloride-dependent neutral and basic amino acid transporter B(0+) isoform X3 [Chinchilla lanigera]|uniref:sodium- and chloride-dependent neutral and basic amino acid transporter B(0+) isoform X3 n=1 Tax=Chinchilla lanigera TaxID=34839 RepID=UPI00069802A3|nr:PREDICTED: sodium- and chloride-dependent neutral and basic amino acid transporter B(0+) isoform X3 [Chinchilla lanigera]
MDKLKCPSFFRCKEKEKVEPLQEELPDNQPANKPADQPTHQPVNQSTHPPADQPTHQPADQHADQQADQPADQNDENDENSVRGNWSRKSDYLLSMIGYAVGLGNVWRFPYLTYSNGGGAFLIPYTIMLIFAGLPLFFLECSLGQFVSQGPVMVWRSVPLLQGIGITMVLISVFVSIYYNVIIAYSIYYLFASLQSSLPWKFCSPPWADENCSSTPIVTHCDVIMGTGEITQVNRSYIYANNLTCINGTHIYQPGQLPSEQYWNKVALQRSSGIDETGHIVWYLALCLLLAWIIVGASVMKGIKTSGKVVYFTALFPYVVLTILLIRGITLEGASKGLAYYIGAESDFSKLLEAEVWKDAATQIFYSLSVAWGGLVALSSYNKFNNNCFSDAIVVCVANCLTSVFAGFAIFSILGHMAHITGQEVSQVVKSGFDLAFIAYPEALAKIPGAQFWSVLFFIMLLTLGLDSQFATIGGNRFISDIEMMIGQQSRGFWLWWKFCWFVITPVLLSIILIWSLVKFRKPEYAGIPFPAWANGIGWIMIVFCVSWIPVMAIIKIVLARGTIYQRFVSSLRPASNWGPYLERHRQGRYQGMVELTAQPGPETTVVPVRRTLTETKF